MLMDFVNSQKGQPDSDMDEEIQHGNDIGVPIRSIVHPIRLRGLSH